MVPEFMTVRIAHIYPLLLFMLALSIGMEVLRVVMLGCVVTLHFRVVERSARDWMRSRGNHMVHVRATPVTPRRTIDRR